MNEWADLAKSILQPLECSEWSSKGLTFGRCDERERREAKMIQHREDSNVLENNRRRKRKESEQKMDQ
jgi:hypothetical protein